MPRLRITASPRGKRSGLALGGDDAGQVSIAVLPKLWREAPSSEPRSVPLGWPLQLVLYETERVDVECSDDQQSLLARLAGWTTRKQSEADGDEDCLLSVQPLDDKSPRSPEAERPGDGRPEPNDALTQLLGLSLLAKTCASARRPLAAAHGGSAGMLVAASRNPQADNPLLLLLQEWQFVEEMERRQREIRRGYVSVTETLGMIRGRITPRGLVQHAATGRPLIECTHDEFTDATPLFRVLVTALEVVASGCSIAHLGKLGEGLATAVTRRAMSLRRGLASIPSFSIPIAHHLAGGLRLSRLQATWQVAVDFARSILEQNPPTLAPPVEGGCAAWWIDTDKLWEAILEKGLDGKEVAAQGAPHGSRDRATGGFYGPWHHLGASKRPDLRVAIDGVGWVMDAKYKPEARTPGTADQYQIFTYALLADGGHPAARRVALVTPHPEPPQQMSSPAAFVHRREVRGDQAAPAIFDLSPLRIGASTISGAAAQLYLIGVSFPTPADLAGSEAMQTWLDKLRDVLPACLRDPQTKAEGTRPLEPQASDDDEELCQEPGAPNPVREGHSSPTSPLTTPTP